MLLWGNFHEEAMIMLHAGKLSQEGDDRICEDMNWIIYVR